MKLFTQTTLVAAILSFCAVLAAFCFWLSSWLRSDEPALDYSALAVEIGSVDSGKNGYTFIRDFSHDYEDGLGDSFEEVLTAPRADWDLEQMRDLVQARHDLIEAFETGFEKELFKFDQPILPDTLVPEVGSFRLYVRTRVIQARIHQMEEDPDRALEILLGLESDLEKYSKSEGGLIQMLTAVACVQILNEAVEDLLAHVTPSRHMLAIAQQKYDIGEQLADVAQTAFRYEFQFACNCIDMMINAPEQLNGGAVNEEGLIAKWKNNKDRVRMRYFFKVNRTKNNFFRVYDEIIGELPKPSSQRKFPDYEEFSAKLSQKGYNRLLSRNVIGDLFSSILLPAISVVVERFDLAQFQCAATRMTFGLQAYHLEHHELPDRLAELMPDYIASIPIDPFDGESLRYDKEQAILYSVGNDFVDNGGSDLPFTFELEEADPGEVAEKDKSEPTFPLRFAM